VSNGGSDFGHDARDASADAAALSGLPSDFRARWPKLATRFTSEHGRLTADVYARDASFAEDLFAGDAGVGTYLLETSDAGVRFGVADPAGHAVADTADDAGPTLSLCARCHASARGGVFPVGP